MASLSPSDMSDNGENNKPPRICQIQEATDSESRPRATPREEKKEKGGYECEFVEPPPKQFQSECSICLLVLRGPHIVSCCGHSFCKTCIGRIQRDGKPCPLCNEPGFTTVANGGLKRSLNEFQVRCTHCELGCEWVDELGKFDQHLNADPQPEHQLEGCQFTSIKCIHCKDHMRRHVIAGHQNERCPKRPYTCEYCEEYESTFEDVVNHWAECKCYLLPCPNNCHPSGSGIKCQNLEHHMKEECSLTVVECDFHYAGCGVKLPRKDMAVHMKEESMVHISLLAAENQRLAKQLLERDEKMQQLMQQNTELSKRIDQQERAHQETADQQQKAIQELRKELMQQNTTLNERSDQQHSAHCVLDQQQKELRKEVTQTMDALQQQQQALQELVQKTDQQQKASQEVIEELARTMQQQQQSSELSNRIDQQERAHQEKTDQQQKANEELRKELTETKDAQQQQERAHQELASKVAAQIQELQQMEKLRQRSQRLVPAIIKMAGFKKLKDTNTKWYSPPFYTHVCGYKICLLVYANGYGDAKGTHVSVYTCLMCGEFDSHLKWPFQGDITIQLLNQLEDREHHTKTIRYTDTTNDKHACQVTVREKAGGLGKIKFIPHSQLNFNRAKNCQYLKDDCLIFRVLSVKIQ